MLLLLFLYVLQRISSIESLSGFLVRYLPQSQQVYPINKSNAIIMMPTKSLRKNNIISMPTAIKNASNPTIFFLSIDTP